MRVGALHKRGGTHPLVHAHRRTLKVTQRDPMTALWPIGSFYSLQ